MEHAAKSVLSLFLELCRSDIKERAQLILDSLDPELPRMWTRASNIKLILDDENDGFLIM